MRPKKYLDGKFIIYDETMPDASDAQLGARSEFAIGGGVIQGEDLGTREGFSKIELNPETRQSHFSVNKAMISLPFVFK